MRTPAKLLPLLAILWATLCFGQATIDGPATAAVSERVTLDLGGLPEFDLAKPIGESLKWTDGVRVAVSAPAESPRLDSTIGIDLLSKRWRLSIAFTPKQPGVYVVAVSDGQAILVHRVTVGVEVPIPDPPKPDPQPVKSLRVVYVWEKDQSAIPRPVAAALNKLNADGLAVAADFEVDTRNGAGQVPAQFKVAHKAAVDNGVPCLVVTSGDVVIRVVKNPTTLESVLEAVKP